MKISPCNSSSSLLCSLYNFSGSLTISLVIPTFSPSYLFLLKKNVSVKQPPKTPPSSSLLSKLNPLPQNIYVNPATKSPPSANIIRPFLTTACNFSHNILDTCRLPIASQKHYCDSLAVIHESTRGHPESWHLAKMSYMNMRKTSPKMGVYTFIWALTQKTTFKKKIHKVPPFLK